MGEEPWLSGFGKKARNDPWIIEGLGFGATSKDFA
jgi:hypothetical protein